MIIAKDTPLSISGNSSKPMGIFGLGTDGKEELAIDNAPRVSSRRKLKTKYKSVII